MSSMKKVLVFLAASALYTFGYIHGRVAERRLHNIKHEFKVEFRETAHGKYYIDLIPVKEDEK